ncbi:phosphatidylinositol-specific phospholipase C domain-containing protein [Aureibacter tunicatorum]|uniref:Phosphatidylinositol diacylglycerol-lyase n=1 Tax=Aureibacter tunicatorum TaxID=866807 RepID=A0AAE4BV65_9BACT|nr:phosphatidylinositol-specific phospholipase C domain-containing protein [Aureibacter tunicatorum]MDR6241468.1 hypothetical protein [Aureibacter tunicatorum]
MKTNKTWLVVIAWLAACSSPMEDLNSIDDNRDYSTLSKNPSINSQVYELVPQEERKLFEISFPCTHNSYNYKGRFEKSNVFDNLPSQFQKGIRAIEIDVHEKSTYHFPFKVKKDISVYHGKATNGANGSRLAHYVLEEVRDFILENPKEMVFLKFETTVSGSQIDKLMDKSGLSGLVFDQIKTNPYPTKEDVIASGKRIIITRQIGNSRFSPSLPRHTAGGGYSDNSDHNPQSQPSENKYFSMQYYGITSVAGYGDADRAKYLNHPSRLGEFVDQTWKLNGKKPWRVIVDFPSVHNNHYYEVIEEMNERAIAKVRIVDESGNIMMKDGSNLYHWNWECAYENGVVMAKTSGECNFPIKAYETITLKPVSNQFDFVPKQVVISHDDNKNDYLVSFIATRK